ncbi:MAG: transcription termination factor NusA [Patescibacteria group bacterium]
MFDLKVINSVLSQLEEERGIPREKILEAIEFALATAYKKEYGKRGQIIRAQFDPNTGSAELNQVKIVVDRDSVVFEEDVPDKDSRKKALDEGRIIFNPEQHIFLEDAKKIKRGVETEEEISFPLESGKEYGRIASQTAKQVIMQKIREAEKASVLSEFGEREGEVVSGTVQRIERGNIFIDMERATGILPYEEQIPGERYRQGERIRAYLYHVEESPRGVFLRLSRSHPSFLEKLFEAETPEIASGIIEVKSVAREPGSRSKIATQTHDDSIDPVGSLVGQRGVRVSTVMSELGGEKIDIIEWSDDPVQFVADSLSPAEVMSVEIDEDNKEAHVEVQEDQQSLAIGKGGQNVRLAARLTGWRIDIKSTEGESVAQADEKGEVEIQEETPVVSKEKEEEPKTEEGTEEEKSDDGSKVEENETEVEDAK